MEGKGEQQMDISVNERPRTRDIGIEIGIMPTGELNSICDVPGLKVGHVTLMEGAGPLIKGRGPIRTGVTAIIPADDISPYRKLPAAVDVINGFGKSVGTVQIIELGEIETPILLTNTLNVGKVSQHLVEWMIEKYPKISSVNPVVMECNDSYLNDIWGMHVAREHVFEALKTAGKNASEGCVGAGAGMRSFGFKSGIGTASRKVKCGENTYILGAIVLNNMGAAGDLRIDGVPIGRMLVEGQGEDKDPPGSIIMVIGTDAPLTSWSLRRVARRASFGLARTGGMASHGSGDIALAFSTVPPVEAQVGDVEMAAGRITQFFRACIESVEEAIINSLLRAHTVLGRDGNTADAILVGRVVHLLTEFGRRE
jgi:D-aminopeptidase